MVISPTEVSGRSKWGKYTPSAKHQGPSLAETQEILVNHYASFLVETFSKLFPTFGSYANSLLSIFKPHYTLTTMK